MSHEKLIERLRKLSAYGCCLEAAAALERAELIEEELRIARDTMFAHNIGNWERCEELIGSAASVAP